MKQIWDQHYSDSVWIVRKDFVGTLSHKASQSHNWFRTATSIKRRYYWIHIPIYQARTLADLIGWVVNTQEGDEG